MAPPRPPPARVPKARLPMKVVPMTVRAPAPILLMALPLWDDPLLGKRCWLRLHEKGGKFHEVPRHHKAQEYLDAYLDAAGIAGEPQSPLFRTLDRRRRLTADRLDRREAL